MLTSQQPIWIGWGPELTYLYTIPRKRVEAAQAHPAPPRPSTLEQKNLSFAGRKAYLPRRASFSPPTAF